MTRDDSGRAVSEDALFDDGPFEVAPFKDVLNVSPCRPKSGLRCGEQRAGVF
jgi:hypothetical protein